MRIKIMIFFLFFSGIAYAGPYFNGTFIGGTMYFSPNEPLLPESMSECKKMNEEYQNILHELQKEISNCERGASFTTKEAELGTCCEKWNPTEAQGLACKTPYPQCADLHEKWYCAALDKKQAYNRCVGTVKARKAWNKATGKDDK